METSQGHGWRGYFGFCQTPSVLEELDSWVRRRLRCVLHRRGVERQLAANTAGSNHGPWRMSVAKAVSAALSNVSFDSLGLPRLADGRVRTRTHGGVTGKANDRLPMSILHFPIVTG